MESAWGGLERSPAGPVAERASRLWAHGDLVVLALVVVMPLNKVYWDIGVRIRPWYLVAPLALLVSGRRVLHSHPVPRPARLAALGLWLIAVAGLASGLWAIDRSAWVNNIGDLALGIMAALAIALAGIGPGRAHRLVTWWVVVGVGMSVYGLLQYAASKYFAIDLDALTVARVSVGLRRSGIDLYAGYHRINSLIEDSSNYSIYLSTVWPLLLFRSLWASASRSARIANVTGLGLVGANLVMTLSRSGLVGATIGLGAATVIVPAVAEVDRRLRHAPRRTLTSLPFRLATVLMAAAASAAVVWRAALARIIDLRTQNSEGTKIHVGTLRDSIGLMLREPWGVGLGGFPRWYQIHREPWEPVRTSTFNSYTDAATSAGALGLLGYLIVLGSLALALWDRACRVAGTRADAAGGLVALISVGVGAFFYPVFATGYFVGFVGLLAAISSTPLEPDGA